MDLKQISVLAAGSLLATALAGFAPARAVDRRAT
jgi:hypothetical protein